MSDFDTANRRALLGQHFLLGRLDDATLDSLLVVATERQFNDAQVIFQKGDTSTSVMAVLRGRVRIGVYSEDGREVILNIIEPGQLFGEVALLDHKERCADATAMGETALLVLDRRDFIPFLEQNSKIVIRLLHVLCKRVRQTSEMVESIAFLDSSARLAKLLLQLADHHGQETDQGLLINLRISQTDLGNLIASTRESVNRQLNAWAQDDMISLEKGRISIRHHKRLQIAAQTSDL